MRSRLLWLAAMILASGAATARAADFHVSPDGKADGDGSRARPWDLRTAIARPAAVKPGDTVWLHGGTYPVTETLKIDESASGAAGSPVTYRAAEGQEVRLAAWRTVAAADFKAVTDPAVLARLDPAARGKVVRLDLAALGVKHVGPLPDIFHDGGNVVELFFGGARMSLSRWPNEGYVAMARVVEKGGTAKGERGGTFEYREDRPARWSAADGVWLDGFWRVPWQPETVRVKSIDASARRITLGAPVPGGIGSKYAGAEGSGKEPWCAVNLLEEIDRPGEWCVHFPSRTLYFWPPAPLEGAAIALSDMDMPMISMGGASHIVLRGIVFEGGRGNCIEIAGGSGVLIAGCTFRNLGGTAVIIRGGSKHAVAGCDIHDVGRGGVYASGGDRKTLAPAGHEIVNNHIWRVGRLKKTYAPPIMLGIYDIGYAAGCRVAHNLIHDNPHAAVLYGGNDNVFEFNEVHHIALDSGDVGAFYTWHDWTSRGNILRYNFIHDSPAANGIYCDDGDSGDTIQGNVFCRTQSGAFIGGGHDNVVRGNIMIECGRAVHIDSRGVARGYNLQNKQMVDAVKSVSPDRPPWSTRFPELAKLLSFHPDLPTGNVVEANVAVRCTKWLNLGGKKEELQYSKIGENLVLAADEDPGFVDAGRLDFRLRPDSPILKKLPAFKPIPFEKIGLYVDEYRPRLPAPRQSEPDAGAPGHPGKE